MLSTPQELKQVFWNACEEGNIEQLQQVLTSSKKSFAHMAQVLTAVNFGLMIACENNHLPVVEFLLTSPQLPNKANIHHNNDQAVRTACLHGYTELARFLTTSPVLKEHANIQAQSGDCFVYACTNGHVDLVKLFMAETNIHNRIRINSMESRTGFKLACENGHLDIIKFMLTSPELKAQGEALNPNNFQSFTEYAMNDACKRGYWDIARFLVFDLNINKSTVVENYTQKYPRLQQFFDIREAHNKMEENLPLKTERTRRKI